MAGFAKEVEELIDAATSQGSENSTAFAPVCDIINSSPDGPKEAEKCFRTRLATQNPSVVMATLRLLDYCVKNCGMRFHLQIFNREFLINLVQVMKPKNNPTKEIRTTMLASIQRWAIAYQGVSELKEVCKTYEELVNKHVEFPQRDPDQISQIYVMSPAGPSLTGPGLGGDRRESSRSIGMPEVCTVYEVEPSSATLCPTGSSRRKSVDPRFPHKNTLNPSGRTPSRDRSPGGGPGGMRRGSYIATVADTDPRAASGQRKQSFVIISNE